MKKTGSFTGNDALVPPEETVDGCYMMPPPFNPTAGKYSTTEARSRKTDNASIRNASIKEDLSCLSHSELLHYAVETTSKLKEWQNAASCLLTSLALSPEMTDIFYSRSLRALLTSALESLDSIDALQHVECSMPSIAAEAPQIDLVQWHGLHFSEWDVQWTPTSWWVSVSADGSRWGLAFNCLAKVSQISLTTRLRCSFSQDLSAVRVRFTGTPHLDMQVDTTVGWGIVPVPVRESIEQMIRSEIENFMDTRLRNDEGMIIVLRRRPLLSLSESDVFEATLQAKRAGNIKLRTTTLF